MKNLYLIGGAMGIGKTTVCQLLKARLPDCVFLDGDWCWDMNPFRVTEETKRMVVDNICYQLNNFLKCSQYRNILFCWVMHEQSIIDHILSQLDTQDCDVKCISLVCEQSALEERLKKDVMAGRRTADVIQRSFDRLPMYDRLNTRKLDVTSLSPEQAADAVQQW